VVGGEGISEALRAHLSQVFKRVVSSYGASDLEINVAVETNLTRALRRRCADIRMPPGRPLKPSRPSLASATS
jgi:hypothetical protein